MKFRKGSRIEVFRKNEAPYGAWRCAEIISGNGHTYNVRYYSFQLAHEEAVMERVTRKIIRPCPPEVSVERWETGELVEVFDNFSWKVATVREELSGKYYAVRILGTPGEFTFHKVNLRVRQSWQDERWVAIGKIFGFVKSSTLTVSDAHHKLQPHTNSILPHESNVAPARILKRPSPYNWSDGAESCTGNPKKKRSLEKEGQQHPFSASSLQKVDVIACRPEKRGGKSHVQASSKNHKSGCHQMIKVRSKGFSESIRAGSLVGDDCYDSDACSVGSCSATNYDESNMPPCMLDGYSRQAETCSSDSESSYGLGEEASWNHLLAADGARRSCRSELSTYRSTLGELFACGPLSWEQETSLTDLRLSLNISDDEHLMEEQCRLVQGKQTFCF